MAVQVMQAGRASVLLRRNGEPVLTIAAAVGIAPGIVPSIRVPLGQGIAGIVAERGMTLLGRVADETFLSTPIITARGVEGVLNMTQRLDGRPYTGMDMASSTAMATHMADLLEYQRETVVDAVSGLPNRKAFDEMLEREIARSERTNSQFSVVFLDLDDLKAVNDRYGHAAGDRLIQTVGYALQGAIRQYDFAARYAGDEFALLLADTQDGESSVTRRISGVSEFRHDLGMTQYSLSLGVAHYPADATTAADLVRVADERMYAYKRARKRERGQRS